MSLTYNQLWTRCQRRTKTESDADALLSFKDDLNTAQSIVATRRSWPELYALQSAIYAQGTESVALTADTDIIQQVRIVSPTNREKTLQFMSKKQFRKMYPVTSNDTQSVPDVCYLSEPTITNGVETKNLNIYPLPDQSYTLSISYKRVVNNMTNPTDYPFFNPNFHQILIDYALWKYSERDPDPTLNPAYFESSWNQGLSELEAFWISEIQELPVILGPDQYLED